MIRNVMVLIVLSFISCNTHEETEIIYKNGTPWSVGKTINDKKEGFWIYFGSEGKVYGHGEYNANKPIGKWYFYNSSGIKEYNFSEGIVNGNIISYNHSGDTLELIWCEHGVSKFRQLDDFGKDESKDYGYSYAVQCMELQFIGDR